jgi:toxin FitB
LALYLASVSLGELKRGIVKLANGKRKVFLQEWLTENVMDRFGDRVLPLGHDICLRWGEMQAQLEKQGTPMPVIDGLIAATALEHQLTIISRNTADMKASGAALLNPWIVSASGP